MIAYFINSEEKTISTFDYSGEFEDLYKKVGCRFLEVAHCFPDQSVIFVDEEALLKPVKYFFTVRGSFQEAFAGNGVYVGREVELKTMSVGMPLDRFKSLIGFREIIG